MPSKTDNQHVNNAKSRPVLYLGRDQACPVPRGGGRSIIYLQLGKSVTLDQYLEHHCEEKDHDDLQAELMNEERSFSVQAPNSICSRGGKTGPEMD